MRLQMRLWVALLALASVSYIRCSGSATSPTSTPNGTAAVSPNSTSHSGRIATTPNAVFRTNPPADGNGVITGPSPLSVLFNMCQTTVTSPDDTLKYTYQWDLSDPTTLERYVCRETHDFTAQSVVQVCTSDKTVAGQVCQQYTVNPIACTSVSTEVTTVAAPGTHLLHSARPSHQDEVAAGQTSVQFWAGAGATVTASARCSGDVAVNLFCAGVNESDDVATPGFAEIQVPMPKNTLCYVRATCGGALSAFSVSVCGATPSVSRLTP